MPRRKAEYKFLGREKWDSQSDDGKIFLALFRERTVGNVRHAAPLDPVLNNFDSVVKYILRWVPELNILQYAESSIRSIHRRLKADALGNSADGRVDEILGAEPSELAQRAAAAAVAASGVRSPSLNKIQIIFGESFKKESVCMCFLNYAKISRNLERTWITDTP